MSPSGGLAFAESATGEPKPHLGAANVNDAQKRFAHVEQERPHPPWGEAQRHQHSWAASEWS